MLFDYETAPWHTVSVTGSWAVLAILALLYMAAIEPFLGRAMHTRFLHRIRTDPSVRIRYYRIIVGFEWAIAAAAIAVVALLPGVSFDSGLPLGIPRFPLFVIITLIALLLVMVASVIAARRVPEPPVLGDEAVAVLLPRTRREKTWWIAVSASAGICEELAYRGLLLALLAAFFPCLPDWGVVIVGAAIFGFAHLYQGAAGVIGTGMIGFLLGAIYLLSGTLLLPIVLHTLIDARAALLTTSQPQPAISQSKPENADGFHD